MIILAFSPLRIALTFLGALLFWTFFEYIAHRFLYHWVSENPRIQKFVYTMHGNHHHYPRDRQRLFLPPVPSLIMASAIFCIAVPDYGQHVFMFFPVFCLAIFCMAACIMRYTPGTRLLNG
jgi:amino acid permease